MPPGTETPTVCPYCHTPSHHPVDKAKGWCARCARFYPEGEGPDPGDERQFQRFNRRRHQLIDQMFAHPDYSFEKYQEDGEKEKALLSPDEQLEYARLNRDVDAWIATTYPLPKLAEIDQLIAEARTLARKHLKEE